MAGEEQTQIESRKRLIEESRPEVDQEGIQDERHHRDLVERQLDGWKTHSSVNQDGTWSDGAYMPWRTYPTPLRDRQSIRWLFILLGGLVISFVLIFVIGYVLL